LKSGGDSKWRLALALEEVNEMLLVIASDPLAPWGQAGAILLVLYLFILVVVGLVLALVLLLALYWVAQKTQLIKRLRPTVESVNTTSEEALQGKLPPPSPNDNKLVRSVAQVPQYTHLADEKVEMVSDRVVHAVIEYRARTEMVKGMAKAFFLPGLTRVPAGHRPTALEQEGVGFRSPGYRILVEEKAPQKTPSEVGDGYSGAISASEIKEAPVDVMVSPPKELRKAAATSAQNKDAHTP
jgi:flagellar basal body-associated protein FliL